MRRNEMGFILAVIFLMIAAMPALASPSVTTIHTFSGADGQEPDTTLIQGANGLLYGSTLEGGTNSHGNLFKLDTSGNNFADFLNFDGAATPFGASPFGSVIQGFDGNLYGTTTFGGAHNDGTVFKVAPDGSGYTDLYDFGGVSNDAVGPVGLIQGFDGNLYGVAQLGGANGDGAIFKIPTTGGPITILHAFGANDLQTPLAALVQGEDGSLYGTAESGGSGNVGGVFRINPDGSGYAVLHNFGGGTTDGAGCLSRLTVGGDGFLYGVTVGAGADGAGTVFKIAPDGAGYQTMYSFTGGAADAAAPEGTLALGNDENLYGTALAGGTANDGVLFDIARNGTTDTLLHSFTGADGVTPQGGLLQATTGVFFGDTNFGTGAAADGTVFMLNNGLPASPTGLYALGSDAQVQLHWTSDINAITYNVYRGTTPSGENATPIATGLATPVYIDNHVTQSTQYFYQVTAVNSGVETARSYEVTAEPMMAIAASGGLSASPNPVLASKTTTGTLTLTQATTGPTTAFLSSSDPSVTFASPDVTVPAGQSSTIFTISTANTGQAVTATITASENGTDASTTLNVTAPAILHTYQAGLQMISANTDDVGITLANDFAQSNPKLAVWTGSSYAITPTAPANSIVPGQGYWFHPTSVTNLYDIGTDQSNSFAVDVPLVAGWNMIGDPYGNSISGADLQVQNGANTLSLVNANAAGLIGGTLYTWQPGDSAYETQPVSTASLQSYEGYWLLVFAPCTLVLQNLP